MGNRMGLIIILSSGLKPRVQNDTVNANSAWGYASAPVKGQKVLPTPDLELVGIKSTWYLRLLNVSDYSGISGWSVSAHILNKSTVYTLNSDNIQVKFTGRPLFRMFRFVQVLRRHLLMRII